MLTLDELTDMNIEEMIEALDWQSLNENRQLCQHHWIPLFSSWTCKDCGIDKRDFERSKK